MSTKISQNLIFPLIEVEKEPKKQKLAIPRKTRCSKQINKKNVTRVYTKNLNKSLATLNLKISITKTGLIVVNINVNRGIK